MTWSVADAGIPVVVLSLGTITKEPMLLTYIKYMVVQVKIFLNTTILTKISFLVLLGTYIFYKHNAFFLLRQYASFSVCVVLTVALVL